MNRFLEQIATFVQENRFAVGGILLLFVMLYCFLIQITAIGALLTRRGLLRRIFHPTNFPKGSFWQDRAYALQAWLDRTAPSEIASPSSVSSATRTYRFVATLGTGDLCDVHRVECERKLHILKVARSPGCDGLLAKEQNVLFQLHERSRGDTYGQYLPVPVEQFRWEHRSCFAYLERAGFLPAAEIVKRYPSGLDGRHVAWMFNRTLEVLGFAHHNGWVHGAVLPPHLLFDPQTHGLQLLGWTHAEPFNQPLRFVPAQFAAWYPRECHRRESATPATDIYLAARSMIWLAGGDPTAATLPHYLPMEIGSFIHSCLADSPSRRPQDAWRLHEEFHDLLEAVYGPPQFCPLLVT